MAEVRSENATKAEALEMLGASLARLPESEMRDATNYLLGVVAGMVMGHDLSRETGAA